MTSPRGVVGGGGALGWVGVGCCAVGVGVGWVVVLWVWEWVGVGLLCCGSGWVVVWGGEGGGAAVGFLNFFMVYCLFLAGSNAGTLCGGAAWLDKDNNKLAQDFYGSGGGEGEGGSFV